MKRGELKRRGQKTRKMKPVVLIVTEGLQTEPLYFNHFRSRDRNIDIQVISGGAGKGGTDYESLSRKAVEYAQRKDLSTQNGDSIWLIVDGDVNYHNPDPFTSKNRQLERAYKIAERKELHIILSNPCFELWYLLHFVYTTAELRDYNAVYDHLKKYIPDYSKVRDVYDILEPLTCQALKHGKRLMNYHMDNGIADVTDVKVNPVTQVWELVEYLLKV